MSIYTVGWIVWGLGFAVLEGLALRDRRLGDTLSEHVWAIFKVRDRRPTALTWALRGLLLAFMTWLTIHFTTGELSL